MSQTHRPITERAASNTPEAGPNSGRGDFRPLRMLAGLSLRDDCVLPAAVRMQKINVGTQEGERNFTASLMPLESLRRQCRSQTIKTKVVVHSCSPTINSHTIHGVCVPGKGSSSCAIDFETAGCPI